ncbi:MAG TPA: nuclear transport factor 2 family protein [Bacteroidales bacterium]|nr:nuclear transport factor 2 family protein [Bacteroidales bacterium]
MKYLIIALLSLIASQVSGQTKQDTLGIEKAALDYVEGWASGDIERVKSAVSPELAKRRFVNAAPGVTYLQDMSASLLAVAAMSNQNGVGMKDFTPDDMLVQEVIIFDIDGTNASAKTWNKKYGFFDYIHLAKSDGKWIIVNVLWDMNSQ